MSTIKEYPMTFEEFVNQFSTEEQCRDYLFQLRWPTGFECPNCMCSEYRVIEKVLYQCKSCKHKTSVTAGTIFQDTRTSLKTWFIAIWWAMAQKYGASAEGLQQVLGLKSYTEQRKHLPTTSRFAERFYGEPGDRGGICVCSSV